MKTTRVFSKLSDAVASGVRRIVSMGGTSSSKTYSTLQMLLYIAMKRSYTGVSISVVSETLPHLRLGAMRDFENILKAEGLYDEGNINRADHLYKFGKSYIEFFSADSGKATGPRRNILYLNECNNIPYSTVEELEQRTDEQIFYDFNPTADFWITSKVFTMPAPNVTIIKSNYLDNQYLKPAIIQEIEYKASVDANYKRVHIDVEFGLTEGLIFTNWRLCDSMPVTTRQSMGLDFGFSNDPTSLVDIAIQNGELWVNEFLYRTGMTNRDIYNFIVSEDIQNRYIKADSAEPKSIKELELMGLNITGVTKGLDSVRKGIDWMKSFPVINVTKRSVNIIREFRNYKWKIDSNGRILNQPIDLFNHAIDAIRYGGEVFQQPLQKAKMTI